MPLFTGNPQRQGIVSATRYPFPHKSDLASTNVPIDSCVLSLQQCQYKRRNIVDSPFPEEYELGQIKHGAMCAVEINILEALEVRKGLSRIS